MTIASNAENHFFRSLLICPGNRPDLMRKLPRPGADIGIICLEDGTPDDEKVASRKTATDGALELMAGGNPSRIFIRVNSPGTEWIEGDLEACVAAGLEYIHIPKTRSVEDVTWIERELVRLERLHGKPPVQLILGIETVEGVRNVWDIARLSTRAIAIHFGAEDFATSLGGRRTVVGHEVLTARSTIAMAARLANLPSIDQSTVEYYDDERFRKDARRGRDLGFAGRVCLHPQQVALCHEMFGPSQEEVDRSHRLITTYEKSLEEGKAVCAFEDEMIDGPLVIRAERILEEAEKLDIVPSGN